MLELFLNEKFLASMCVCFGGRTEIGRRKRNEGKKERIYLILLVLAIVLPWTGL